MAVDELQTGVMPPGTPEAGSASGRGRTPFVVLCFGIPAAVLTGSYLWLAIDHGTSNPWNVIVHESGLYTLRETVFYFSHFLREVPTLLAYGLFLLSASGAFAGRRRSAGQGSLLGWVLIVAAAVLVAGSLLGMAVTRGPESALADLLQFRTRDDQSGYGTHWRFHWLSTLWFGAAVGLAPGAASRLVGEPVLLPNRFWTVLAWSYFTLLTVIFGLSENVVLDLHYVGHQAREIMTHGPVTLLLGLGILVSLRSEDTSPRAEATAGSVAVPWIFGALLVGVPAFLVLASLSGDVLAEGQRELGLSAMVAAHYFEHTLDYLLVALVVTGSALLMRSGAPVEETAPPIRMSTGDLPEEDAVGEEESPLERLAHAVSVVIPAFNERRYVARQIRQVAEVMSGTDWEYEIIVVDDGSSDGTGAAALAEGVRVLRNRRNRGYGASLKRGIAAAQNDWVLITDADGTYPASAIPGLLALADENEMVVGARVTQKREIPVARRPAKWFLTRLASYLARRPLPDLNSGLRLIRRDLVDRYLYLLPSGFSFTTTITLAAASNEHEVSYVPIDYHARIGESKIRPGHALDFLLLVLRIIVFFNPLRVFVPIGALMAVLGLAKLAYDLTLQNISESALLGLLGALVVWAVGLLADQNATIARRR